MSNALVVGGLDDGDKVVGAEHRILGDHFAAEVSNLLVYLVQTVWVAVQRPASLGRQRAQQNIRWHRAFLFRRSVVQGDGSLSGFAWATFKPLRLWQTSVKSHGFRVASGSKVSMLAHCIPQSTRLRELPPLGLWTGP